jgi:hypothetical protein
MLLTPTRLITAALLVASAATFAVGVTIEHHTATSESHPVHQEQRPEAGKNPTGENPTGENPTGENPTGENPTGEQPTGAESAASGEKPATHAAEHSPENSSENSSEDLLGINPEATGLVVIAVAVSVLLAALILTVGSPLLAAVVALVMLAFTALDIREVTHQLNESHSGLAALAATIALLHLAAGAVALLTTRDTRSKPRPSTA